MEIKPKLECKRCRSNNVTKCGFRDTQHRGRIQKYRCQDCKTSFSTADYARFKMNPATIDQILALYENGLSTRQIAKKIGIISHVTAANIINKVFVRE